MTKLLPPLLALTLLACGNETRITDADAYLDQLPDYPAAPEPFDRATGAASFEYQESQVCSTTTYEIGDAPAEVVMFNADPQIFWPGALIQGDSYESGSPKLIPLADRAPLNLSIQGVYADESAAFDVDPTPSAVQSAINGLLSGAVRDEVPSTQSVYFEQKEAYSFAQAALDLGFSARYLGARVSGSLSYETTSEVNTVAANATIRTFTVSVDPPTTPSAFFQGLSEKSLQEQIDLGRLSEDNLPVYVASVTYGQIMMFSASSTESSKDLQAALSASFNSFAGGGSGSLSGEQQQLLQGSQIKVVTLGGSEEGVADLIANGDPSAFFRGSTVVTSSVPIGYTLKDLHGNVVKVGETADYGLTTCSPNGFANFYVHNSGSSGFTSGYYGDGTRADLANEQMGSPDALDIAYDSLEDRLYVLDVSWGEAVYIDIFEANGERPAKPVAHGGNNFAVEDGAFGMTYDPVNARIYVLGGLSWPGHPGDGRAHVARAWATDGYSLDLSFAVDIPQGFYWIQGNAGVYDALNDRLLVAAWVNGPGGDHGTVYAFDKRGNELQLEGDFPGIVDPSGIAWNPTLGHIYVADETGDVRVFDDQGRPVTLESPITGLAEPTAVYFDTTSNRLYVLEADASLISAFEPSGAEAVGLATPQFPGLNQPTSMTFRP